MSKHPVLRLIDLALDTKDLSLDQVATLCTTMDLAMRRMRQAGSAQPAGNVVALPGVDLEAACRAQRRRRKAVRP